MPKIPFKSSKQAARNSAKRSFRELFIEETEVQDSFVLVEDGVKTYQDATIILKGEKAQIRAS